MKKFLLYFLLPGIVLGTVYSMGKSAGKREIVPVAAADFNVVQGEPTSVLHREVPATIAKPANVSRARNQVRSQTNAERYQVRAAPRVIETQELPGNTALQQANIPAPAPVHSVYNRAAMPNDFPFRGRQRLARKESF